MSETPKPDRKASNLEEIRLELAMIMLTVQEIQSRATRVLGKLNDLQMKVGKFISAEQVNEVLDGSPATSSPSYEEVTQG